MLLVEIFIGKSELGTRDSGNFVLDVTFGRGIVFEFALNSIHGQVLARSQEIHLFKALKQLAAHFTRKSIVVFVTHVDNELPVIIRSGFCYSENVGNLDAPLELYTQYSSDSFRLLTLLLHVADFVSSEEELPLLSHTPFVVLCDFAGKDHCLAFFQICHHSGLVAQV